jgi:myosin heavy subunit
MIEYGKVPTAPRPDHKQTAKETDLFDYAGLTSSVALEVRSAAERIRVRMRRTAEDIIAIGFDLIAVKDRLPHGDFLPWVKTEFGMKPTSASYFMNAARTYGDKLSIIENLSPTVIFELASPSTTEPVRDTIEQKAASGETVTVEEVKRLKRELEETTKRAENSAGEAERFKKQAETLLEGQAALVEKAKQEAREKIEADLKAAKEEAEKAKSGLNDAQTRLSEAEKKAEEAATAKAQAQAAKVADEEVQKRQKELDAAKKDLDKIRSEISKRNEILTDIENRVEERRSFLDKLTNADHEAEQLVKELEEMNRVLALALLVVSDVDYDHGEEVLSKVRSSASMCRRMAEALDAIGRPRLVFDARA